MDAKPDRQLGAWETTAARLDRAAGGRLDDVFAEIPMDDADRSRLPHDGWRLIAERHDNWTNQAYAAPLPDESNGWAMVLVSVAPDGNTRVSAELGPELVRPSRFTRARGLELHWPDDPMTWAAGQEPEFDVLLHNGSGERSFADGGDSAHVRGWVLDGTGRRLPAPDYFAYGFRDPIPALAPGADARLPVTLATSDSAGIAPGRYRVEAMLASLGVWSSRGKLVIT